jgi:hypothetical protein
MPTRPQWPLTTTWGHPNSLCCVDMQKSNINNVPASSMEKQERGTDVNKGRKRRTRHIAVVVANKWRLFFSITTALLVLDGTSIKHKLLHGMCSEVLVNY